MTGGSSQLSLQGSQDKFLHYMAQSSFFVSYHTTYENFSIEPIQITPQGRMEFGQQSQFNIGAYADMICGAAIELTLPALTAPNGYDIAWCHSVGIYAFRYIEFKAQAQILDTQYAQYIDLYSRVAVSASHREGFNDMIGEINLVNRFVDGHSVLPNTYKPNAPQVLQAQKPQVKILLPLFFWWCLDYSMALPIGILLYTNLSIHVHMRSVDELYILSAGSPALSTRPSIVDAKLWVDYVYLDESARLRLAKNAAFYVFKQVQHPNSVSVNTPTFSYKMPFMMPVAELIFGVQEDDAVAPNVRRWDWWDRYNGNPNNLPDEPLTQVEIKLNGQKRLEARDYLYHNRYEMFKHHTSSPSSRGVWVYSFALFPEQPDANGAANFSRTDNKYIDFRFNQEGGNGIGAHSGNIYLFALNYNYLYIENGFLTLIYNA